jgi:acetyl esterase/lipase
VDYSGTLTILCLQTAERLAAALDAEDYEAVRACLSASCVYHGPDGVLTGRDAIVASYREVGEAGRGRFEEIKYESQARLEGPDSVVITFTDHLRLGRAWHRFSCRQYVRVGSDGLVEAIQHEEIPGERERLHQFEMQAAPREVIPVAQPVAPVTFPQRPGNSNVLPRSSPKASLAPLMDVSPAGQGVPTGLVLVVFSMLLFWTPFIGFGLAVAAVLMNIGVRGWPRRLAWVSTGLSLAATAAFVMATAAFVTLSSRAPSPGRNPGSRTVSLSEARKGFRTKLVSRERDSEPAPEPPSDLFRTVHYESPPGQLVAYLTADPADARKHPAIIWITGGDCNSIGDVWTDAPVENDQSARAFREAGIVMMFPSLRGGNDNPGTKESFLGEVDDVLAAQAYLARQPYVDAGRIYLGGHSTGGTLALLVAECSERFRAIFSFGPANDVRGYGSEFLPFDKSDPREAELRSPGPWLGSVKTPTFVFEGTQRPGNIAALTAMAGSTKNPALHFIPAQGANHFSVLSPVTGLIAEKILMDNGPKCNLALSAEEIRDLLAR